MDFSQLEHSVWQRLAGERRPIVLYGMGDGADKILTQFERFGIKISAVFASDEFVRGHSFHGFKVQRLCEVQEKFGEDIVIVIAFASQRPEVLERMYALDAKFDVVAPDVPVVGEELFDADFIRRHAERMEHSYALLADEQSRRVFLDTVRFKLSGRLCYLRQSETAKEEIFTSVLHPSRQERFADLGAYNGDTIRELLSYTGGQFASITALEPDRRNFRKLSRYTEEMLNGEVRLVQAGAWCCDTEKCFAAKAGRQSCITEKGIQVQMRALDSVLNGAVCTMLKMDVEGAEYEALRGAENTIRRFRPKLNIAAYHRSGDFFELPIMVHSLCPDYQIYLRHHPYVRTCMGYKLVCGIRKKSFVC